MVTVVVTTLTSLTALTLERANIFGICDTCLFGWLSNRWNVYVPLFGSIVGIAGITGFNVAVRCAAQFLFFPHMSYRANISLQW